MLKLFIKGEIKENNKFKQFEKLVKMKWSWSTYNVQLAKESLTESCHTICCPVQCLSTIQHRICLIVSNTIIQGN